MQISLLLQLRLSGLIRHKNPGSDICILSASPLIWELNPGRSHVSYRYLLVRKVSEC